MDRVKEIKGAFSAALAVLTALWGWFGWLVVAWIGCMMLDVGTGMAAAAKDGRWSSTIAREGLWHKAGCVSAVAISGVLDLVVGVILANLPGMELPFTYTVFLCPMVVTWYILTEVGSIVENAGAMGAPIPAWLKRAIEKLRDQIDRE